MSGDLHGKQQVFRKAGTDHLKYEVDNKKGYKKSLEIEKSQDFTIKRFGTSTEEQSNQPLEQCEKSLLVAYQK